MKRLLCIWLPNWPIQSQRIREIEQASNVGSPDESSKTPSPEVLWDDRQKPTIIWADDARRGRHVVACCRRASMLGVQFAMPLVQAKQRIQSTTNDPDGSVVTAYDPFADRQSLDAIAEFVQQHISPKVSIETVDEAPWAGFPRHQPESLLCDISGVEHLFGGPAGLVETTQQLFKRYCHAFPLHVRTAIAPNVAAAWALAHFGGSATEIVEEPVGAIEALPIEALRLSIDTVNTLHRLGVQTIDQLLALPRSGLATRLGKPLLTRIAQAIGQLEEPLLIAQRSKDLCESIELEYPTRDLPILIDRCQRLLEKIKAGLTARKHGAVCLRCRLGLSSRPPITLEIGLFAPSLDADHLLSLLKTRLETVSLASDVVNLTLTVSLSAPLRAHQAMLFAEHSVMASDQNRSLGGSEVSVLVDTLAGRLGRNAVLGVRTEQDPLPENAYREFPLTGSRALEPRNRDVARVPRNFLRNDVDDQALDERLPSRHDAMRRPLTVFDTAIALTPLDPSGGPISGNEMREMPSAFRFRGKTHRVRYHWGPERIETQWWNGTSIRRDYYRVETESGQWWWIYRALSPAAKAASKKSPIWMLHGQFA